jgi:hypothetical protein
VRKYDVDDRNILIELRLADDVEDRTSFNNGGRTAAVLVDVDER